MSTEKITMHNEFIKEILLKVESTIEESGYCRAGYAIKEVLNIPNKDVLEHDKVKIASLICKDGKYISELALNKTYFDLNIKPNPESNWFKRNPWKTEMIRVFITIVVALITAYLTIKFRLTSS